MREMENFCVGCPQGCIQCGRYKDVEVVSCDRCGESIIDWDDLITDTEVNEESGYLDLCRYCATVLEEELDDEDTDDGNIV